MSSLNVCVYTWADVPLLGKEHVYTRPIVPPPLPPRLYKQIPRVDGKEQVFDWFVQFALRSPCIRTEEEEEAKKALDVYSRSISRLFSQARMDLYAVKCCCWITKEAQTDDGQLFKKKEKSCGTVGVHTGGAVHRKTRGRRRVAKALTCCAIN
jgi:hypothetical protein